MAARLGELLIRENIISLQQLHKAQTAQQTEGGKLGFHLTKLGFVSEQELTKFLSRQYGVPAINLDDFQIPEDVIELIPKELANKHRLIPVNRAGAALIVAMSDPSNIFAIDDIKFKTGYNVEPVVAAEASILKAITYYYDEAAKARSKYVINLEELLEDLEGADDELISPEEEEEAELIDLEDAASQSPVIRFVNAILVDAMRKGTSDIHIEPYEKEFRIRYRIDGSLQEVMQPPIKYANALTSRIKILANLDIAERRLPQDGRIKIKLAGGGEMDFRVSICPTLFGEKTVLRLLDSSNLQLDMTKLGFDEDQIDIWMRNIVKPYGMCLVTGPTGSGKTTTLYSALASLNNEDVNISTAEDPVEFNFAGINQVQMHEDIGLNFASALRSFLRQDPDIIMVGEIRDFETGEIAIKAALTGHMVLSTLHTNDAPATVTRLLNMGIEPFLVTAAVNVVVAQRLGKRICKDCKIPADVDKSVLLKAEVPENLIGTFQPMQGRGCPTCNNTGYKGRVAFYEVLEMKDALKELVLNGVSTLELKAEAIKLGFKTLRMSAISHLINGVTTVDEVLGRTVSDYD